jgi:chromosome segregation protein
MYLKHLTINGFKSFAKKGELEFSAPITAIVGPNGSGKSNVAEAFRFVLGEQSIKGMRAKKGEDLIFNGSDSVSRANRAVVEVVLDNRSKVFPVDFEEITLERVVHRDGQNEYSINGSKVRLKDVQELLAAANIGPSGHHIISQGEADRILSASPKERREMIEDALGLKVYQFKKQEAEKKLKKTKENIERVESLRREVAPHLRFLERQVKKLERSVALREELRGAYLAYLRREDVYLAHHVDRLQREKHAPEVRLQEISERLEAAKATLALAEQDEKRAALVSAERVLHDARESRQSLMKTLGSLEGQISYVMRRIEAERTRAKEVSHPPIPYAQLSGHVERIEADVAKALQSTDAPRLQRALQDIVHSLKQFLRQATERETVSTAVEETELESLRAAHAETERAVREATGAEESAFARYQEVKVAIEAEQSESREAERAMFALVSEQREVELVLNRIEAELAALARDRQEFKDELQEAVALLGRAAADYYHFEIIDEAGAPVPHDAVVTEARNFQRERRRTLEKMKIRLEELGGANEDIEKEYQEVKARDEFLANEIADLTASVAKLEALIVDLNAQLNERFVSGIDLIGKEFNTFFTLMFGGGETALARVKPKVRKKVDEAVDGEDEALGEAEEGEEGIDLSVKLPNKRVSGLAMLSGGERALTSIALIFAMSQVNPPLFIILDETDAALDEANSRRYGDMITALAKKSQLILITHNRETMSRAGILYGVTMAGDGVSKLLSVKLEDAVAVAK